VRLDSAQQLPTSPQAQGRVGAITYASSPIDAFTVGFDESTSTRVTADEVTVSLASDVLFGVDESTLAAQAQAVIDAAGVQITAQGAAGAVHVTARTDKPSIAVGSLEVTRVASGSGFVAGLFGDMMQGRAASRGLSLFTMTAGAHNATLLGTSSRYYPADYLRTDSDPGSDLRSVIADQWIGAQLTQGASVTVTVLWPDPGGDTVTIDVPARFRLTDVPVTSL
jgi:hypothetical protein